jgi:phosphoribosylanthranilate isomerase
MLYIKICCIANKDEAHLAISLGASAVGLVSEMPSGPGVVAEADIIEIAHSVPPPIARFLLTSLQTATEIVAQQRRTGCETLQLVDAVPVPELLTLRATLPGVRLVQVIHVTGEESLAEAVHVAPFVDALLLDSGNPTLEVKELGGTGRRHDWSISRRIRDAVPIPLFLAGGLNADNVAEAIATVDPFGVDICSGVRTNDALDETKLTRFIAEARG